MSGQYIEKSRVIIGLLLLVFHVSYFECKVCQKDQTSCTSPNSKYTKLNKYNDFIIDNSFLLSSSDSSNNLRCLAMCSTNDQCIFSVFKQNKCYLCNEKIIRYFRYNSAGNSLIYQKSNSKYF
jgi:hypothetical protein